MANRIIHKSNSVAGVSPTLSDLAYGEIAINTEDGLIFLRKRNDTIIKIGANNTALIWHAPALLNGWNEYSTAWPVRYAQDIEGNVHIKGRVKGGNKYQDTVIFTLPVGMQPSSPISISVNTHLGFGELIINSNGGVVYTGTNSSGDANTSLGITATFKGDPTLVNNVPIIWHAPALLNGWIQYSNTWLVRYAKDAEGNVHIKGRVKGGNRYNTSVIFKLPVGMRPSSNVMFNQVTQNGMARTVVYSNGDVSYIGADSSGLANISLSITAVFKGEI